MPHSFRHSFAAAGVAALMLAGTAVPTFLMSAAPAIAQQDQAPKQISLTQKQIDGLIAAQPDMVAAQPQAGGNSDQPDAKLQAKMEQVAKKHGFANLEEYGQVSDSISIVLAGIDPETKKYVGPSTLIKKQVKEVEADKGMKPQEKAQALKELKDAMAQGDGVKPLPGNAEIVGKNYDRLAQLMQGGEGQ